MRDDPVAPGCTDGSSRGGCRSRRSRRTVQDRSLGSARARRRASPRCVPGLGWTFFPGPAEVPGDHPAHRRMTDANAFSRLPPLAEFFERRIRMRLQVRQQPGLQPGPLRTRRTRPWRLRQTPRLPLPTPPARQRRCRYPEQPNHLRTGRPHIQRVQRPDPHIPRIGLHAHSLTKRSPFRQRAVTRVIRNLDLC